MLEFATTRALASHVGLRVDTSDARGENFPAESDWGIYRGSGFGLRGTTDSGWLVTFAGRGQTLDGEMRGGGFLIAHAIEESEAPEAGWDGFSPSADAPGRTFKFGGRCILLGGPWASDFEAGLLREAGQQDWFESSPGGAKVNVEMLDSWLSSKGLGVS